MDDSEIIGLLTERDERGLKALEEKFRRLIMKIALGVLNSREDAEDCLNDTLMAVWNAIPPENPNNLTAYVCKIARRLTLNRLRYNTAESRSFDLLSELEECVPSDGNSIEEEAEFAELKAALDTWADSLDERQHKLFMLRYFYLQSVKDAAKACGMTQNAAGVALKRLRDSLKKYLIERGFIYDQQEIT